MKDDEGCGKSAYAKLVEEKLKAKGVDKELFEVIYYGSSDTKSTNKFRNCDAMILCGDWLIPTFKMEQINEAYEANICSDDYKLWYWSQLISRIGIRNHDGGTYNVYYSDDYDSSFIQNLDAYFNLNQFSHIQETEACNDWKQKLKDKTNFRKNHKQDIISLGEYDKNIADAIMYGNEYELKISLKEISKIVVRKGKRDWDSYKTLIEKLALLKIRVIKG
jgi:hypothetical protein